jgi:HD-GYP domain-containing protein (c-di-GMP phosphodiesterase class II)
MSATIAVEELRVGMYVQLDGGWMSHPFALSSFRIVQAEQLLAIQRMGMSHVRWVPEKSELPVDAAAALAEPGAAAVQPNKGKDVARSLPRPPALTPQRQAASRCEEQYRQAAALWCDASQQVRVDPRDAGLQTVALARALLGKLYMAEEVGIRLLSTPGNDESTHALNVTVISLLMGRALGLSAEELMDLGAGALAHDVGKWQVAEQHRHLQDKASAEDIAAYRDHVALGATLGQRMGLSEGALTVLAQHHEHADGSGFPAGLPADRQSLAARIVAFVNCYDRLCNPASRQPALTPHEAVATLFALGHKRFDGTVLNAFIRLMGVYPVGSLVQLTDDRYALVVSVNSKRPLKPCVWVHEPQAGAHAETQWLDLQQTPNLGIRRSLTAQRLPADALQALAPSARVVYFFEALAPKTAAAPSCPATPARAQRAQAA